MIYYSLVFQDYANCRYEIDFLAEGTTHLALMGETCGVEFGGYGIKWIMVYSTPLILYRIFLFKLKLNAMLEIRAISALRTGFFTKPTRRKIVRRLLW